MHNYLIINQQNDFKIPKAYLESSLLKIINILSAKKIISKSQKNMSLNLVFVKPYEIKKLNNNFREKNKETDILSFGSADPFLLGELVFCPKVIVKNAELNQWPQKYEYLYMLVHGVLHLLGYDHENDLDSKKMFKLQDLVFNQISEGPKVNN
jgi:probable rRNA maturation factor